MSTDGGGWTETSGIVLEGLVLVDFGLTIHEFEIGDLKTEFWKLSVALEKLVNGKREWTTSSSMRPGPTFTAIISV